MAPLLGILYISKAQIEFNTSDLVSLGEKASGKNQQIRYHGLILYFERGDFLQYIEGSPEQVVALMKTIELDYKTSGNKPRTCQSRRAKVSRLAHAIIYPRPNLER